MHPSFGVRYPEWGTDALSAYTWLRTTRGPEKAWLFKLGKRKDPTSPCDHHTQDGDPLTFTCSRFESTKREYLRDKRTWVELDLPDWRKERDESYDVTEAFFDFLYDEL